jgi:hypothetical protein
VTGSFPRLLGAATVGAGVAAAGYVGLVTGACPLDLGLGRRVRPLGPQLVEMAAPASWSSTSSPSPTWVGPRGRWPPSSGCWNAAATWCWRLTSPPWVGGWGWSPDGGDGPVHPARAGRLPAGPRAGSPCGGGLRAQRAGRWAGTRLAYRGEIGADLWRAGQYWCALVARRWEQTVAASLAAVKVEAERRATSTAGTHGSSPDPPRPTTGR